MWAHGIVNHYHLGSRAPVHSKKVVRLKVPSTLGAPYQYQTEVVGPSIHGETDLGSGQLH